MARRERFEEERTAGTRRRHDEHRPRRARRDHPLERQAGPQHPPLEHTIRGDTVRRDDDIGAEPGRRRAHAVTQLLEGRPAVRLLAVQRMELAPVAHQRIEEPPVL